MTRLRWRLARWLLGYPFVRVPETASIVWAKDGFVVAMECETLQVDLSTELGAFPDDNEPWTYAPAKSRRVFAGTFKGHTAT